MYDAIAEIQRKLEIIASFQHTLDQSSYNTLYIIRYMVYNSAKHDLLQHYMSSITELLDTFIGLATAEKQLGAREYVLPMTIRYVPATSTLSPSHTSTYLRAERADLQTFKQLSEYRAELNRQARQLIESQENEIRQLHYVIAFLVSGDVTPIFDACKRGDSGLDAVKGFFQAKPATQEDSSLLKLSQSDFGRATTELIEGVAAKKPGKSQLGRDTSAETNYERALRYLKK